MDFHDEMLINNVRIRNVLWDQRNSGHHNRYLLDLKWEEIAKIMGVDQKILRTRWKLLRDKYRKLATDDRRYRSGDSAQPSASGKWIHFKSLEFLKDQFKPRNTGSNFKDMNETDSSGFFEGTQSDKVSETLETCSSNQHTVPENVMSPHVDTEDIEFAIPPSPTLSINHTQSSTSSSNSTSKKRRQDWGREIVDLERKKLAILEEKKQKTREDDDDLRFFQSLIPIIRNFTPLQKLKYRRRIMDFTEDFLTEDVMILSADDIAISN